MEAQKENPQVKPASTAPTQVQHYDTSISNSAKALGIKGSTTPEILYNAAQEGKFDKLMRLTGEDAEKNKYWGQSRDQFLTGFSNYLKQLGFNITLETLNKLLSGTASNAEIKAIDNMIAQNFIDKDREDRLGQQKETKEQLKEAVDKVTPQKEGIEHQP